MTIKQFSALCGCNPQTLRYYDHVDLLKPAKVDEWSGYRFYDEEQALTFVKIKNLQKAGFSIEEIRELLDKDDRVIYEAFEAKIAEEERRLREIKEIQLSYQTESMQMKSKIEEIKESVLGAMERYDAAAEFGVTNEEYRGIIGRIDSVMTASESWIDTNDLGQLVDMFNVTASFKTDDTAVAEADEEDDEMPDRSAVLNDPNYSVVYEKHGFEHVKDFIGEFAQLEEGAEYLLYFLRTESKAERIPFMNVMLNVLLDKNPGKKLNLNCDVGASDDGRNHFWLLKKR